MIVEFRIKNFCSLHDEQIINFEVSEDDVLMGSYAINTGLKDAPRLLKSAIVYRANSSEITKALQFMRAVVVASAGIQPIREFKLDNNRFYQPTEFNLTFVFDDIRYRYGFILNTQRIIREKLLSYNGLNERLIFDRKFNKEKENYVYEFCETICDIYRFV